MNEKRIFVSMADCDEADENYENSIRDKPALDMDEDHELQDVVREKPIIDEDKELEVVVREKPTYNASPQRHRNGIIALDDSMSVSTGQSRSVSVNTRSLRVSSSESETRMNASRSVNDRGINQRVVTSAVQSSSGSAEVTTL